ncbi:MAG TPA: fatty acid desaturase [Acidocella sp.]|nr:fatty acid desaturase [Acidocella sp.]
MLIVAYAGIGYALGVLLLTLPGIVWNGLGVLLLSHTLIVSAYIIHECTHGTIFAKSVDNDRLGETMGWLNGACLAPYAGLKDKHLRHHADRLDVVTFDYRAVLKSGPAWFRNAVLALEWAYIPAVEFLMRGMVIYTQCTEGDRLQRRRVLLVLASRVFLFMLLALVSLKAVVLYAVAYILFIHVLRFQDAFQHTFDVFATRTKAPVPLELRRDRTYEHTNTYSDVISYGHPWANLLLLNFSYHNAHHAKPAAPWYQLPKLHEQLYANDMTQVLPCSSLFKSYHKYRVSRVLADDYGVVAPDGRRADGFLGAVGVSFLTAI